MKVLIVLLLSVAAIAAMPTEEKSDNENLNTVPALDFEQVGVDVDYFNGLVRDKRQYGGYGGGYGGYGGGGGFGRGGYGGGGYGRGGYGGGGYGRGGYGGGRGGYGGGYGGYGR